MTVREFETLKAKSEKLDKEREQWFIDNPFFNFKQKEFYSSIWCLSQTNDSTEFQIKRSLKDIESAVQSENSWFYDHQNPIQKSEFDHYAYEIFDDTNLNYDVILKDISDKMKKFNRMSLIIQGLLDRSEVFHPHPPAKIWDHEGFTQMINLVYDQASTLHHGDKPDIKAYIEKVNSLATEDSIFYGQQDLWELHEGEKECARRDNSWRHSDSERPKRYKPDGNNGPTNLAKAHKITRTGKVTFAWARTIEAWNSDAYGEKRRCTFTAPIHKLFNISAYKKGDYKQFFNDARTRAEYLKWAPMLLTAEDYLSGKIDDEVLEPYNP